MRATLLAFAIIAALAPDYLQLHGSESPARVKELREKFGLPLIKAIGVVSPLVRELPTTLYQFSAPFVIDDHETRSTFGLEPTPWHDVLEDTIASFATR